jgi:hypothetical protein
LETNADERIILKFIEQKCAVKMWTRENPKAKIKEE